MIENGEAGEAVLNFAESFEYGATIIGDGGVVVGLRELNLGSPGAARKNTFRDVCTNRPKRALHVGEFGDVGSLPPAGAKKTQRRIVSGFSDSDLRVGDGHLTFGFGDVGAALQ